MGSRLLARRTAGAAERGQTRSRGGAEGRLGLPKENAPGSHSGARRCCPPREGKREKASRRGRPVSNGPSESRGSFPGPFWGGPRVRPPPFTPPSSGSRSACLQSLPKFKLPTLGTCAWERRTRGVEVARGEGPQPGFSELPRPWWPPGGSGGENRRRETWSVVGRRAAARGRPSPGQRATRGAVPRVAPLHLAPAAGKPTNREKTVGGGGGAVFNLARLSAAKAPTPPTLAGPAGPRAPCSAGPAPRPLPGRAGPGEAALRAQASRRPTRRVEPGRALAAGWALSLTLQPPPGAPGLRLARSVPPGGRGGAAARRPRARRVRPLVS
uniref:proline-rich protein 2-like n=1 Tax=Odobenus rosmarus divergens TaxID=9708 RepID=UPI00063CBEF8|nr:PREDICTED: proline-rich protein 2-like [Odobenus rosmarus divergens]